MKKTKKNKRWKMIADPKFQGILCLRVAVYWFFCQVTIFATLFGFAFLEGSASGTIKRLMVPAMITSVMVLPVALLDLIVFSNRFAGPILNFRKRFDKLVKNGVAEELRFRPGDYYPDLQDNFHRVCEQLDHQDPSAEANGDPEKRVPQVTS